ncbi:MAG: reverse transcriptase domain-containing protein [Ruminiclostridium sp.]|nr:reverse transcriptase domain-containing protein [Ruminiclostridium sp.]
MTVIEYQKNLDENLENLVQRLKEKKYKAKLVRRVFIPKGQGKLRPLGIPCLEDKIVQQVCADILMSIWNGLFISSNFGYRPNTSAKDAVKELSRKMLYGKYRYVVEADIKGFFDNLNHEWLYRMLEERISDKAFLQLISKWLKAGILNEGSVGHPVKGSPQGGVTSPVLANIYLHYVLDMWFEKAVKPNYKKLSSKDKIRRLDKLLLSLGFDKRQPRSGSSHYTYTFEEMTITIPYKRPYVKIKYVKDVIEFMDKLGY